MKGLIRLQEERIRLSDGRDPYPSHKAAAHGKGQQVSKIGTLNTHAMALEEGEQRL